MNKTDDPIEPEILNPGGKGSSKTTSYRTRYTQYTQETKQGSTAVFLLSITAFFLSLIPVIGVVLALAAMILAKFKHSSMILAVFAFVIGCVSTTLFLLFVLVLRWIF